MSHATIWLVDDDRIYHFAASSYISEIDSSIEVLSFEDCEEALKTLQQSAPNPTAILLDVNMPVMDGWDFLDAYAEALSQQQRNSIQIYIVSSSVDKSDKEKADKHSDVSDFISKPINKEDFENLIKRIKENT